MNEVTDATHPIKQESADLVGSIAGADTRLKASRLECEAQALTLKLELSGMLSSLDADNLKTVFQMALEKRLHDLEQS